MRTPRVQYLGPAHPMNGRRRSPQAQLVMASLLAKGGEYGGNPKHGMGRRDGRGA